MSSSAVSEAEEASLAFQAALARIGIVVVAEALAAWSRVDPGRASSSTAPWISTTTRMVLSRRGQARELAVAYFRLTRALRTGRTVPDPDAPSADAPTLGELRRRFAELADSTYVEVGARPANDTDRYRATGRTGDSTRVLVEREGRGAPDDDAAYERGVRESLDELATQGLLDRLKHIDAHAVTGAELDAARDDAARLAGAEAAARAEREVLNGARGELFARAASDRRVIGWVRLSRTGTPCSWCAMLISRGFVYFSKESAARSSDGDLYHDNCHCYADPVYSRSEYDTSERYTLNREYAKLWPEVTKGHSGRDAQNAWRRHFYDQRRGEINAERRERHARNRELINARRREATQKRGRASRTA